MRVQQVAKFVFIYLFKIYIYIYIIKDKIVHSTGENSNPLLQYEISQTVQPAKFCRLRNSCFFTYAPKINQNLQK